MPKKVIIYKIYEYMVIKFLKNQLELNIEEFQLILLNMSAHPLSRPIPQA